MTVFQEKITFSYRTPLYPASLYQLKEGASYRKVQDLSA